MIQSESYNNRTSLIRAKLLTKGTFTPYGMAQCSSQSVPPPGLDTHYNDITQSYSGSELFAEITWKQAGTELCQAQLS